MKFETIGVVGGGAWGTAIAQTMCAADCRVVLWARESEIVQEVNARHVNSVFLPGISLDERLRASTSLSDIAACDVVLVVAPAQHVRAVANELSSLLRSGHPVVVCAKGIEQATGKLMGEVLADALPEATFAVLSGPSFAVDVARGLPTALTIACANETLGRSLAESLGTRHFRLYWSSDTVGVEIGGAMKNVLAIAAGVVDGRGLGASAHAALVTRGFAEMCRLGLALGARTETLCGLSGLGDLVLTCGSPQSRNMSLGRALGQGRRLSDILGERKAVTEGVYTAEALVRVGRAKNVELPISEAVHAIIAGYTTVDEAIAGLLARPFKAESS